MNQKAVTIFEDSKFLDLENLSPDLEETLRTVATLGGDVLWNREGETRLVSNGVLTDALETMDFWKNAPEKWQVEPPTTVGKVYWSETTAYTPRLKAGDDPGEDSTNPAAS